MQAQRNVLPGGRLHYQHGPIDLVIAAEGNEAAVAAAHEAAWQRFTTVLAELVAELLLLRQPVQAGMPCPLQGPVARRMWRACAALDAGFITPMAAVAGAVAQDLAGCYQRPGIVRAWVNNGGDIALHLAPGAQARVGLFADIARFDARSGLRTDGPALASPSGPAGRVDGAPPLATDARFTIDAAMPVRGVATSGWRGRSFSLGIADSVTVLARTAAEADAAATVIANAVDADHPGIVRRPACELKDDTDLGELPVTVDVPPLPPALVAAALQAGRQRARQLQSRGLIHAAVLVCQGRFTGVDNDDPARLAPAAAAAVGSPGTAGPPRGSCRSVLA